MSDNVTAIVAHDAGAANHIVSWLRSGFLGGSNTQICFEGPAKKIYMESGLLIENLSLEEVFGNATMLISGTGWSSDLEHRARGVAAKKKLHSIAVLDHWCNYRERFRRNNEEYLPDCFWVTDEYAFELARKIFIGKKVFLKENHYIQFLCREVDDLSLEYSSGNTILFVMEPIRDPWCEGGTLGEIQAFDFFMNNLESVSAEPGVDVVIRPHPSDMTGKYDSLIQKYKTVRASVRMGVEGSLAEQIANSNIVVGCQTHAMVVALAAGKKVISALPPHAPECNLPHSEIIRLTEMVNKK